MLMPFQYTDHLFSQWANNELVSSGTIQNAVEEAGFDAMDEDDFLNTRAYAHFVCKHLVGKKAGNIAWQLASHSLRNRKIMEDILSFLEDKEYMLSHISSLTPEGPLETMRALIASVKEIKNDPAKLSPIKNAVPPDILHKIWREIIFDEKGKLAKIRGISKAFDQLFKDRLIDEINTQKLNLPDLGFHSMRRINKYFGNQVSELKYISFQWNTDNTAIVWKKYKKERIRNKIAQIKQRHILEPTLQTVDEIKPTDSKGQQELFVEFIASLKGIDSLRINYNDLKNLQCILSKSDFLNLCKNNPGLKEIYLIHPDFRNSDILEAIKNLKLNVLKFIDPVKESDVDFLNQLNLSDIKNLSYSFIKEGEIEALKNCKNLEKAYFVWNKFFFMGQIIDKILTNLKSTKVCELVIECEESFTGNQKFGLQKFSQFPPHLKTLELREIRVDLNSLFSSISKNPSLTELCLVRCAVVGGEEALAAFKKCIDLKKVHFHECGFVSRDSSNPTYNDQYVADLKKANPNIQSSFTGL